MSRRLEFPNGKRFAFTVIDDTDVATRENTEPLYRLLEQLGFRTTKTVWPLGWSGGYSNYESSETLESPGYTEYALDLQRRGFEIASHGATMESSTREITLRALQKFRETFGGPARVYANHGHNRENVYWGVDRLDDPILRPLYAQLNGRPADWYQGHVPGSPWWWGDHCSAEHRFVRNLTFDEINLLHINPSLPYRDSARPWVQWWFSASDAEDCAAFNRLLRPESQERLEREGGVCIVATHFGKGFVKAGVVNDETTRLLTLLSRRDGWFPTVGDLLDWLAERRGNGALPRAEWRRMQWRWASELAVRHGMGGARAIWSRLAGHGRRPVVG